MAEDETPQIPFDMNNLMGLQADILKTLKEHGIEPGGMAGFDVSKIPGMSDRIQEEMEQAKEMQQAWLGNLGSAAHDDPVDQLARLAELHEKGVLSDSEFDFAKRKLLDQNWSDG
jgi:hypothetical protein